MNNTNDRNVDHFKDLQNHYYNTSGGLSPETEAALEGFSSYVTPKNDYNTKKESISSSKVTVERKKVLVNLNNFKSAIMYAVGTLAVAATITIGITSAYNSVNSTPTKYAEDLVDYDKNTTTTFESGEYRYKTNDQAIDIFESAHPDLHLYVTINDMSNDVSDTFSLRERDNCNYLFEAINKIAPNYENVEFIFDPIGCEDYNSFLAKHNFTHETYLEYMENIARAEQETNRTENEVEDAKRM